MLVFLEGLGKMAFDDGSSLAIGGNHALYCPPQTGHDVVHTGTRSLRYAYVVSGAKQADTPANLVDIGRRLHRCEQFRLA